MGPKMWQKLFRPSEQLILEWMGRRLGTILLSSSLNTFMVLAHGKSGKGSRSFFAVQATPAGQIKWILTCYAPLVKLITWRWKGAVGYTVHISYVFLRDSPLAVEVGVTRIVEHGELGIPYMKKFENEWKLLKKMYIICTVEHAL